MAAPDAVGVEPGGDESTITKQQWRWSVLAAMASYLDAGSIVALGAGLTLFQAELGLSSVGVGALAAIGPNAIGCAIGAFVGGRLGDKLGRKRIYKWDLLVYALGILLIAFAVDPVMLFAGTFIVGVAVGADVPTSLALVGEFAPAKGRGKLIGLTQVAWSLGPVVVLVLALVLSPLGLLGTRIVFIHLALVALVTWALRRGMVESARWTAARERTVRLAELFRGPNLRALAWTASIYTFWGLAAGTAGIFTPYVIETLGAGTQAAGIALSCVGFVIGIASCVFVFMPYNDRSYRTRRIMWGVGALLQITAYALYLVLPFTVPVVIANIVLFGIGSSLAGEPTYKVFSQELFPTMLRGTAQGFTFGVARTLLGVWSFFVPVLAAVEIGPVALLLTAFLLISGVIGFFWMPDTVGKSLEQIEAERAAA
ncbi:MFS transporter [Pseudonocardia cypriaca]|uniref:Inositol transporter-like SP family MFS transporter n=1 Tax=Pseudonocardia cypriaca TaxID=882449 RepID=A0A543FU72_9PSEU|nr:MFS transporter [Pseudonocardia cypriaca]TQM37381.1 inositol transporter-like SP family MFS transporter [Pseudonocardia cypriaca]